MQFTIKTSKREEIIDITSQIQAIVSRYAVKEGLVNVFTQHTTTAITINENSDENVCLDILESLRKIAPKGQWKHDSCDGNGDAHIKSSLIGSSVTIPIQNNRLMLGRWQAILFCELDGPRERTIIVNVLNTK
jgi:secondary thiamine-phosphate synthase enzyme